MTITSNPQHLTATTSVEQELADRVTGLLNRRGLGHALTDRTDEPIGVVFTDVDGFKRLNDRYGHPVGDAVLVELAKRVTEATPPEYVAGRFGGDQFTVFLPGVTDIAVVQTAAETLLRVCDTPVTIGKVAINVHLSIGVAIAPPRDLLQGMCDADVAMYEAKARGRARAVCLSPEWEAS